MKKLLAFAVVAAMGCIPVLAQEHTGNNAVAAAEGEKIEVPQEVAMLQVAGQLVKYGYEQEAALPLIQAVEIYQNTAGSGTRAGEKTTEGAESAAGTDEKASKADFDITRLLADATTFADGDANYLALIEGLKNSATRGATQNYSAHHDSVRAHGTDVYTIRFRGGERACVVVSGDGDTDLDLYVYDENGNLVDSDTDYTDECVAVWTPRWTGNFQIKIKNRGNVYNRYVMTVN